MEDVGIELSGRLHDRCEPVDLEKQDAHVVYVDNCCAISSCPKRAVQMRDAVWRLASQKGLFVHETFEGSSFEFLGLDFCGDMGFIQLTQKRYWRLHQAIKRLLQVGRISAKGMQKAVGVASWSMLLNRPLLSIFSAVYSFAQDGDLRISSLWPSVKRELGILQALLPFCR